MAKSVQISYASVTVFCVRSLGSPKQEVTSMKDYKITHTYDPASGVFGFKLESMENGAWRNSTVEEIQGAIDESMWALSFLEGNPAAAKSRAK